MTLMIDILKSLELNWYYKIGIIKSNNYRVPLVAHDIGDTSTPPSTKWTIDLLFSKEQTLLFSLICHVPPPSPSPHPIRQRCLGNPELYFILRTWTFVWNSIQGLNRRKKNCHKKIFKHTKHSLPQGNFFSPFRILSLPESRYNFLLTSLLKWYFFNIGLA